MTYIKYFKLKLSSILEYRTSAISGIITQVFWGFMMLSIYISFFKNNINVNISLKQTIAYLWLYQSFLSFIGVKLSFPEITDSIKTGNVAYEIIRPYNLYFWWLIKIIAKRVTNGLLKFLPVLLIAFHLPEPYNLPLPNSITSLLLFLLTFILGIILVSSLNLLIYSIAFFTYNSNGIESIITSIMNFLSGSVVPVILLPNIIQKITYYLPFRYISDLPFRIYSGNISISSGTSSIIIQIIWILLLIIIGNMIVKKSLKKVFIQGG